MSDNLASTNPKKSISQYFEFLIQVFETFTNKKLAKDKGLHVIPLKQRPISHKCEKIENQEISVVETTDLDELNLDSINDDNIWAYAEKHVKSRFKPLEFDFKSNLCTIYTDRDWVKVDELTKLNHETALAELAKFREEALLKYESIINEINLDDKNQVEVERRVFSEKFMFIVQYDSSPFQLFLIITDFYLEKRDICLLRYFLN